MTERTQSGIHDTVTLTDQTREVNDLLHRYGCAYVRLDHPAGEEGEIVGATTLVYQDPNHVEERYDLGMQPNMSRAAWQTLRDALETRLRNDYAADLISKSDM